MKAMNKRFLMILALLLALTLGAAAFAEGTGETAAEAAPAATEEAAASTDTATADAQTEANALNDALTAYGNAKAAGRKQELLDSLKQELDSYVAAGSLTQEQADLILKYYTEQLTLNGSGFGRGGKGTRNGQNGKGAQQGGFGRGGKGVRNGRFGSTPSVPDAGTGATPIASAPALPDQTLFLTPDIASGI